MRHYGAVVTSLDLHPFPSSLDTAQQAISDRSVSSSYGFQMFTYTVGHAPILTTLGHFISVVPIAQ